MAENRWLLNGVVLPRSPDTVQWPLVKANVTYETMLDGAQRRIALPRKFQARDCRLGWKAADSRTRNALWAALVSNSLNVIQIAGVLPARSLSVYFDDLVKDQISDQIYDPRAGQGGFRRDIEIGGRGEPYFRSVALVPASGATQNSVNAAFGGPSGDYAIDIIPTWSGNQWKLSAGAASSALSPLVSISNMGTAPWTPKIRFIGPYSAISLNPRYLDVDGSGLGVTWTWTGGTILTGDYVLYDTDANRCYQSVSGVLTEVYTYTLTNQNTGTPFGYFPAMPSGSFAIYTSWSGAGAGVSSIDFSNNGTETFRYV